MTEQPPTYPTSGPYSASFEGYTAHVEDWPNTVTVEAVTGYDPTPEGDPADTDTFADQLGERGLVEIDTNYKPTRPGNHPVRLTRADAVKFAASVLEATDDTFDYLRCGQLRATEAAALLRALEGIEYRLGELRDHARHDLLNATGLGPQPADLPATEPATDRATVTPTMTEQLETAVGELFPTAANAITTDPAFGLLVDKITQRCQQTGETPRQVLRAIDPNDHVFTFDEPATFLARNLDRRPTPTTKAPEGGEH